MAPTKRKSLGGDSGPKAKAKSQNKKAAELPALDSNELKMPHVALFKKQQRSDTLEQHASLDSYFATKFSDKAASAYLLTCLHAARPRC